MTTDTGRAMILAAKRARGALDHYTTYHRLAKLPLAAIQRAYIITHHAIARTRGETRGELMTAAGVLALALHRDLPRTYTIRRIVQ